MTVQAHISPARVGSRNLSRGDLGLFLLAGFAVAEQEPLTSSMTLGHVLDALGRQNLFLVFALYVAARRFLSSGKDLGLSRTDWALAAIGTVLFGIVCFTGVYQLAGLVLTLLLIPLRFTGARDKEFNSALLVCGALAINSFWGPLLFQTFTATIIGFDTTLLHWAYALLRPDIQQHGVTFQQSNGFGIVVVGACSVFNSASVAFLAATAMTQLLKPGFGRRDIAVLLMVLASMIAINTGRLIVMGWGHEQFAFWHDGPGGLYISFGQTIVIAAVALLGARWAVKDRT